MKRSWEEGVRHICVDCCFAIGIQRIGFCYRDTTKVKKTGFGLPHCRMLGGIIIGGEKKKRKSKWEVDALSPRQKQVEDEWRIPNNNNIRYFSFSSTHFFFLLLVLLLVDIYTQIFVYNIIITNIIKFIINNIIIWFIIAHRWKRKIPNVVVVAIAFLWVIWFIIDSLYYKLILWFIIWEFFLSNYENCCFLHGDKMKKKKKK